MDAHVLALLQEKELDDEKVLSISGIKIEYKEELNNLIRARSMSDMYDKKYYELYRKSNN